ncbi:DUF6585 family protein [Zavarzinella formosa]|uniref:DUF6585 family protein n=1 Tax=Zavarzinella formosa TaxID=360055 RepID=UPI0002E563D7|nr:DUF6585 family protein [Zavarzinella formosa]
MDDSPDTTPRDIGSDLAEITSRLGEPDSMHQTNRGRVIWRFVFGVFLVVASAVFHYLFWTEEIPWPAARHFKLWAFILIAGVVGPGGGLALIGFAVKSMKMWVLTYPAGLFVWHRGQVWAYPWGDIVSLQFSGLPPKAAFNLLKLSDDPPEMGWYDLEKSSGRIFGTSITLERANGEEVSIPSMLDDFAELGERIQRETFTQIFPVLRERLRAGETVEVQPFAISPIGLTYDKKELTWAEMERIDRVGEELHIFNKDKRRPWKKVPMGVVKNLHIFMGLVEAMLTSDRGKTEPSREENDGEKS